MGNEGSSSRFEFDTTIPADSSKGIDSAVSIACTALHSTLEQLAQDAGAMAEGSVPEDNDVLALLTEVSVSDPDVVDVTFHLERDFEPDLRFEVDITIPADSSKGIDSAVSTACTVLHSALEKLAQEVNVMAMKYRMLSDGLSPKYPILE